jgi:CBS domain containing-hemolysin-like protein
MNFDTIIEVSLKIFAVLALVFLNGFFVASEFAIVKIRDTQLDPFVVKAWWCATWTPP